MTLLPTVERKVGQLSPRWVAVGVAVVVLLALSFTTFPGLFVDQFVGGIVYGMILMLIAIGLSLILGLLGVVNFAHGALFMLGAYGAYHLVAVLGIPFWAALVVVPITVGLLGVIVEVAVLRRVYDSNPLIGFLATFGVAIMFTEATRAVWGGTPLSFQTPDVLRSSVDIGVTSIGAVRLFTVVVGTLVITLLYLAIQRTSFGLTVRAGVQDREMTEILGVNIPLRFTIVFFVGVAIAALSGVLRGAEVGMDVGIAEQFVVLAFVVVVVGGVGSLFGSVVSALLIGEAQFLTPVVLAMLAETLGVPWLQIDGIGGLVPYLVMIVVLLVRPRGLFGQEGLLE